MNFKTIAIIMSSVLLTIVLMNNREDIHFWFFGDVCASKLIVFGMIFIMGFFVGVFVVRPTKKPIHMEAEQLASHETTLSEEDREYIQ